MNDTASRLSEAEIEKFKKFSAQIPDNDFLQGLLAQSTATNRRQMYASLLPYLTFKPKPYWFFAKRMKKA